MVRYRRYEQCEYTGSGVSSVNDNMGQGDRFSEVSSVVPEGPGQQRFGTQTAAEDAIDSLPERLEKRASHPDFVSSPQASCT